MTVRDDRRPFAWVTRDSLEHIRKHVPSGRQVPVRNALLALAEAASVRHDGEHEHGDGIRALAALAGMSEKRLRPHLVELERIGLVHVEHRQDDHGRDLSAIYVLRDAPISGTDESSHRGDESSGGSDGLAPKRPPLRARVRDPEEEERSESAVADSDLHETRGSAPVDKGNSIEQARQLWRTLGDEREQQAIRALVELADARGLTDGWNPAGALELMRDEFRNRDVAGEAGRFRDFYSPGGLGENRQISNLVARWREWLKRAPSLDTLASRARPAPGRRGRRPAAARTTRRPLVVVPCELADDPAIAEEAARRWQPIAGRLKTAVSEGTWVLYLEKLHLHSEQDGQLVIAAPPDDVAWITDRFSQLLTGAAEQPIRIVACSGPAAIEDSAA